MESETPLTTMESRIRSEVDEYQEEQNNRSVHSEVDHNQEHYEQRDVPINTSRNESEENKEKLQDRGQEKPLQTKGLTVGGKPTAEKATTTSPLNAPGQCNSVRSCLGQCRRRFSVPETIIRR